MTSFLVWLSLLSAGIQLFFGIRFLIFDNKLCLAQSWWSAIVPVLGAMTQVSWIIIFSWLVLGIILSLSLDGFGKKAILPIVIVAWFVFVSGIISADSRCRRFVSCGPEFNKSVVAVLSRAFNHLEPKVCDELDGFADICGSSESLMSVEECRRRVSSVDRYQQALVDVSSCRKSFSDCASEANSFFRDNLSNNLATAEIQCQQKFSNNTKQSDLCRYYLETWRSQGSKP